jgi:hypothetical protein
MCGPSNALQGINNQIQAFTDNVSKEADTVFGGAESVFNNIMGATQNIVKGGPEQNGFSSAELASRNATATTAGATATRNLEAAGETSTGTAPTAPGTNQELQLSAERAGESLAAQGIAENKIEDATTGRQNYDAAVKLEQEAPNVLGVANQFNQTEGAQQERAATSQQNIDTQKSWWKDPAMKAGAAAAQFIPVIGPFVSMAIKATDKNYEQEQAAAQQDAAQGEASADKESQSQSEQDSPMTPPPTSSSASPYSGGDWASGSGWGNGPGNVPA